MSKIREIRQNIAIHRDEFEARKKVEYERESADLQTELRLAIRDEYAAGISVTKICENYGTKDRGTVIKILKTFPGVYEAKPGRGRPALHGGLPTATPEVVAPQDSPPAAVVWDGDTATFTYPGSEETVQVVADVEQRKFRFTPETTATPEQRQEMNKARTNPEHWLWGVLGG